MKSFRIGRIDFINTAPVYYGIDTGRVAIPGCTVLAPPSILNRMLAAGEIQISSISSVAYLKNHAKWYLLPGLSISARGPVHSVLLCMKEPVRNGELQRIGLSDKSETAKALTRILLEDRIGCNPEYLEVDLTNGVPQDLNGVLIIGDDALMLDYRTAYPHVIDLGAYWFDWTGLPFVFGLFAVDRAFADRHPLETAAVARALLASKNLGKMEIQGAARLASDRTGLSEDVCATYLRHIEYDLAEKHLEGLKRFYGLLKARGEAAHDVEPAFWTPAGEGAFLEQ